MKLKKEFITYNSQGESFLVPSGGTKFAGLVKGNKTLGAILECLKEDRDENELLVLMSERFDATDDVLRKDIKTAIDNLRMIGALDE